MFWTVLFKNWKTIGIVALLLGVVFIYTQWQKEKSERIIQERNNTNLRNKDSLQFTEQVLSKDQISDYLKNENQNLKTLLKNSSIRENRLMSIVSSNYHYTDTIVKQYDVSSILDAINKKQELSVLWKDTTKCMTIEGDVKYNDNQLTVHVTNRDFKNKSDGVVYWQRRQWKLFWFNTRILGKKEFTSKQFDQCGKTQIIKIEKKK